MRMSPGEFRTVVDETQRELRAFIVGWGIPYWDADDIAQETYLHFFEQGRCPADVAPIRWLKGIARNLCRDHVKRQDARCRGHAALAQILRREQGDEQQPEPPGEQVRACIAELPPLQQRMVHLRFTEGLSTAEVAAQLECNHNTVRVTLMRIRGVLRTRLAGRLSRKDG